MGVQQKFESNQLYQIEAVSAVVDLFEGWLPGVDVSEPSGLVDLNEIEARDITRNYLGISDKQLLENALRIQERKRVNLQGQEVAVVPLDQRLTPEQIKAPLRNFSVEMETGTGKTYVYLRTALELYKKYGLTKFIVVVPRVAIREGVVTALKQTKDHFKELFEGVTIHGYPYDSSQIGMLRHFATETGLQILVMNIQAFANDRALIHKPDFDRLQGHTPIDFITKTNPVLILDEPQLLEGEKWRQAIDSLNPLFKLRYSATHRSEGKHCMVYRLGPVDAYERRLVKKIQVLSMASDEDKNIAFVEVRSIDKHAGHATIVVNKRDSRGRITVRAGSKLDELTGLEVYKGWTVEQIHAPSAASPGFVEFANGRKLALHENADIDTSWMIRTQFQAAIESQFETELKLRRLADQEVIKPTKALTLFFIDKVDKYYPTGSIYRQWFEEIYEQVRGADQYKHLNLPIATDAHLGYFAMSNGSAKDTRGDGAADSEAYRLIMQGKEELIDVNNKVRFIFSHSALSEGWDNPNVFTICHLQDTNSTMKKRQQIGRGLRLPVMSDGTRCRDSNVNIVTVIAKETFAEFASGLQTEFRCDGETFGPPVNDARATVTITRKKNFELLPGFNELWEKVRVRTSYKLDFSAEKLVDGIAKRMKALGDTHPIRKPRVKFEKVEVEISYGAGVQAGRSRTTRQLDVEYKIPMTDIVRQITKSTGLTRQTVIRAIEASGRTQEIGLNPNEFMSQFARCAKEALGDLLVTKNGIAYSENKLSERKFDLDIFPETQVAFTSNVVKVGKSITDYISCDSDIEKNFAEQIDDNDEIELFIKLPTKFLIPTPIGGYNPDWAIVRKKSSGKRILYLVRETKGNTVIRDLRFESEGWKIFFGMKHFEAIAVDFNIAKVAADIDLDIPLQSQFQFEFDTFNFIERTNKKNAEIDKKNQ